MRRATQLFLALLALWFIGASSAHAQQICPGINQPLMPMPSKTEAITVSTTAIGFTAANITNTATGQQAIAAVCVLETNAVRYRDDGVAPTAGAGLLPPTPTATAPVQIVVCNRQSVVNIKFIRVSADATLTCSYYTLQQ